VAGWRRRILLQRLHVRQEKFGKIGWPVHIRLYRLPNRPLFGFKKGKLRGVRHWSDSRSNRGKQLQGVPQGQVYELPRIHSCRKQLHRLSSRICSKLCGPSSLCPVCQRQTSGPDGPIHMQRVRCRKICRSEVPNELQDLSYWPRRCRRSTIMQGLRCRAIHVEQANVRLVLWQQGSQFESIRL
jgi:hypothetical protein